MRLVDAVREMTDARASKGYSVRFEWRRGGMLEGDRVPHRDEPLFETEEQAWHFAAMFAAGLGGQKICNVYVVDDNGTPVDGYRDRRYLPR